MITVSIDGKRIERIYLRNSNTWARWMRHCAKMAGIAPYTCGNALRQVSFSRSCQRRFLIFLAMIHHRFRVLIARHERSLLDCSNTRYLNVYLLPPIIQKLFFFSKKFKLLGEMSDMTISTVTPFPFFMFYDIYYICVIYDTYTWCVICYA